MAMTLHFEIWRQPSAKADGKFVKYTLKHVEKDMSFLEAIDILNDDLVKRGEDPIAIESDCREGICGSCGVVINGQAHGPLRAATTCQLHCRVFEDGETVVIEPWRARAFPVVKDLMVDRSALDRIISVGGYTSAKTGPHADANAMLIPKDIQEEAMDSAACIGCGACVAACPNASVHLFTAAKLNQLARLPQGQVEADRRAYRMVSQMALEGFGNCTNIGECQAACPKSISIDNIARMRQEYWKAALKGRGVERSAGGAG